MMKNKLTARTIIALPLLTITLLLTGCANTESTAPAQTQEPATAQTAEPATETAPTNKEYEAGCNKISNLKLDAILAVAALKGTDDSPIIKKATDFADYTKEMEKEAINAAELFPEDSVEQAKTESIVRELGHLNNGLVEALTNNSGATTQIQSFKATMNMTNDLIQRCHTKGHIINVE